MYKYISHNNQSPADPWGSLFTGMENNIFRLMSDLTHLSIKLVNCSLLPSYTLLAETLKI